MSVASLNTLLARRIGIDTYLEPVVYIRADSPVCRSEGFAPQTRVKARRSGMLPRTCSPSDRRTPDGVAGRVSRVACVAGIRNQPIKELADGVTPPSAFAG